MKLSEVIKLSEDNEQFFYNEKDPNSSFIGGYIVFKKKVYMFNKEGLPVKIMNVSDFIFSKLEVLETPNAVKSWEMIFFVKGQAYIQTERLAALLHRQCCQVNHNITDENTLSGWETSVNPYTCRNECLGIAKGILSNTRYEHARSVILRLQSLKNKLEVKLTLKNE